MRGILRAKMQVTAVLRSPWGNSRDENVQLSAVYSNDPNSENYEWSKATPSGTLQLLISNPGAQGKLKMGQQFYVDLVPVEE